MKRKRLFLIDAMALIYRSFYALNKNPRINSKGVNTSAILGFANTLLDIITKYKPDFIGVAFDLQEATFRHEEYAEYKANRQAMPEDLMSAIPYIKSLIKAMNIPVLSSSGYEADDVIGTLAKKAAKENNLEVFMVTPDKDYAQLVDENIFILKLGRAGNPDEVWTEKEVLRKFDIRKVSQVIDMLALWGDSADNIPGAKGIGEKKAQALMQQFDNVEQMLENTSLIQAQSVRKAIEESREMIFLSKKLATINLNVPIELNEEELMLKEPNVVQCEKIFDELEFRSFSKRFFSVFKNNAESLNVVSNDSVKNNNGGYIQTDLFGESQDNNVSALSKHKNISNVEHSYLFIENNQQAEEIIALIRQKGYFCFDTETTGLDIFDSLIGISFSIEPHKGWFLYLGDKKDIKTELQIWKSLFEDETIEKTGHNMKFDKNVLLNYDIEVKGKHFDTLIAHYLLETESRHKLDYLAMSMLDYEMISFENVFGKVRKGIPINSASLDKDLLKEYAVEDADICLQLKPLLERRLKEDKMCDLFENIEMPLIDVLLSMEREGVTLDVSQLHEYSLQLGERKTELERLIYQAAGVVFNISSPKQLGEILFERLKIVGDKGKIEKTSVSKQFATGEDVLQKLVNKHEIISLILEYRSLTKLISTYIDALPLLVNKKTGKIHTSFNQSNTATGRLSSNNPNLQNIPVRTELGKEIRKAFVARDSNDFVLLAADYSQIELRIIASLSGDAHLCQAFNEGMDIHLATAAKIYKVSTEEVTKEMRRNAKSVNFGIIYGISAFGLSQQLNITRAEAQQLIKEYFINFPQLKTYIENCILKAREQGYVTTICGRRRYLSEINSRNFNLKAFAERNAVNMPVQGSSADMIKLAMIAINKYIKDNNLRSRMILQVHDELVFDVYRKELEQMKTKVCELMTNAMPLNVPVIVDCKAGDNWLEAH
ncbi:MAG: DNA polymerase I [Bacteroidales bacterium]|jgi:DNA polymerase-1|nr:DNA polymerase I [Bacteroidales bacterium]